jgi:hypothetical protein
VKKISSSQKEKIAERLIEMIVDGFKKSGYPASSYSFRYQFDKSGVDVVELHIRIPSIRPSYIDEKFDSHRERNAACPAIERISLPEWLRRQGFFRSIVNALGNLSSVDAVCVSHVTNSELEMYLEGEIDWCRIENKYLSESPFSEFFQSEPPTYCKIFKANLNQA